MDSTKKNQPAFKIALLSISLLLTSSGSIASTVSRMQETFSDHSATAVEALVTASNITVMIFVLLSAFLVRIFGTKKTVLLGILLAGVGGVVPFFSDNYTLVYASRLVLGAGLGMFNSLAVSLINEFYSGDQRNKMLGYQAAVQSLGQTITTFIAGILVNYNWHYAYAIYFFAAVSFILFLVYVPDTKASVEAAQSSEPKTKQSINLFVILQTLVLMLSFVLLMALSLKATAIVQEHNMANPEFLGTALSVNTLISFLGSFFYGNIVKVTKQYTLVICYAVLGIGFVMASFATNMIMLTIVFAIMGFGAATFLPYSFGIIMEKAPKNSANLAVSISMVGTNLGCYLSPYVLAFIGDMFGNSSASFSLLACGVIFGILAVVYLFVSRTLKPDNKDIEPQLEVEGAK